MPPDEPTEAKPPILTADERNSRGKVLYIQRISVRKDL